MSYNRDYGRDRENDCRIYVGNLPYDIRSKDIESIFGKFGPIENVDLKNQREPSFAFVEFKDPRDAEDAVRERDGYNFDDHKLRVEHPKGNKQRGRNMAPRGRGRGPPTRRSQYRVLVTGLPPSGSWQDLKDHMREAGDVCYADVNKDGSGVVEFIRREDMKYAVKKLDDTKFRSHEGEVAYIRVDEDGPSSSRSRSRSISPPRRGGRDSRSRSPEYRRRSRSP